MTPSQYLQLSARTDTQTQRDNFHNAYQLDPEGTADLIHATDGVVTEAGELKDAVKKHLFYGREIDLVNIKEEIGDTLWYLAKLCRQYGFTFEDCMDVNIEKLKARFPNAFTNDAANNRNLPRERSVLEQGGGNLPDSKKTTMVKAG